MPAPWGGACGGWPLGRGDEPHPSRLLVATAWAASVGEVHLSHDQVRMYRGMPIGDAVHMAKVLEMASAISQKTQM